MTDWHESRTNTYEYYLVDPNTWMNKRKLGDIKPGGSITRDATTDTLIAASLSFDGDDLGEFYVRIYLVTIQNGIRDRKVLGTFLAQTSSTSFDGKLSTPSVSAYSPLLELREVSPPLGYNIKKNQRILPIVTKSIQENSRLQVVPTSAPNDNLEVDFVADPSDTWLDFNLGLIKRANHYLDIDEMGKIMFAPNQSVESIQPVFTYNDDDASILYPEITKEIDIYGIPNTLEVVYSGDDHYLVATAVNDDPNSIVSTVSRGRVVFQREDNPDILGKPTQRELDEYAEKKLKELSEVNCQLTYQHGFNDVRIFDCVRLNYVRAGLTNIKALVIKQTINCDTECKVDETVVYKKKLWG